MFWDILAYTVLAGIVILLVLAILEPGPLAERRPSKRSRGRGSPASSEDPEVDAPGQEAP